MNSTLSPADAAGGAARAAPTSRRWQLSVSDDLAYRLAVVSRAVAAIAGGYGVSSLAAVAIALYLPTPPVEAAIAGTLAAFVVYPCAAIWVFAVRSAWRAWGGLLALAAVLGGLVVPHYLLAGL